MSKTMKALSLYQPWASLMAVGAKKIETRSWSTPYRGLIAIHAAQKWDRDLRDQCMGSPFYERLFGDGHFENSTKLPRGGFVAVGKLRHCLSTTRDAKFIPSMDADEFRFGDYSPRRFMWVFDEIRRSAPRAHILKLSRAGVGRHALSEASDVRATTIQEIRSGKNRQIRKRTESRILSVTAAAGAGGALVPAGPTWRRINRLLREGFTRAEIARRLGYKRPALQLNKDFVTAKNAAAVRRLYDRVMK